MVATEELSVVDNQYLTVVAAYCPHDYGEVVTWARGLLSMQGITSYDDPDCDRTQIVERKREEDLSTHTSFAIYPSPANNYVDIEINNGKRNGGYTVTIQNYSGVIVETLDMTETSVRLGTEQLQNGMYTVIIQNDDHVVHHQKLVIIH